MDKMKCSGNRVIFWKYFFFFFFSPKSSSKIIKPRQYTYTHTQTCWGKKADQLTLMLMLHIHWGQSRLPAQALCTGHLSPANGHGAQALMEEALGHTWSCVHEYPHPSTILSPASCRHLVQLSLIFSLSKLKANTWQRAVSVISKHVGIITWILWQQVIWKNDTRVTRQKHKGLLQKRTSALPLWKKSNATTAVYRNMFSVSVGNIYLQKHSSFAIIRSSGRTTKHRGLPALSALHLATYFELKLFYFFFISFPNLFLWKLSRRIKIDQGLLNLISGTIWLHFTKIQTLGVSLSQHS